MLARFGSHSLAISLEIDQKWELSELFDDYDPSKMV